MSGYLMRLVSRGSKTSQAPSLQPSVRTSSPVAEHDQRIGMTDFEGFEFGEASLGEGSSEAGAEQGNTLQPLAPPIAMTASETGKATIQRKMAGPPASIVDPGTPIARGEAAAEAQTLARSQPWRSIADVPDLADAHGLAVSPSTPPIVAPAFATGGIHPEVASLTDSQTGSTSRRFDPGIAHAQSIRQTRQLDSTRLEPSAGALAEHFKPAIERTDEPSADPYEGPRVVIGRINVEVVPPPAAPPSTAAPRSGPLTAASVSVIGPLGENIRPSLRLSMRHR